MKKVLLSFCMLLGIVGNMQAADKFSVDNVTLPINDEADVVVRFSLDANSTCSGYTFWLQVPDKLAFSTYEKNEKTYITYTAGDCYDDTPTITPNIDGGYLKVGCITANSDPLNKKTGILVTFKIKVAGTVSVGDVLNCTLTKGTISASSGSVHDVADASFTVTIGEPDDGRIKFDENATSLPTYTDGAIADVTMKRTIKANEWSTIVLPFTLSKAKAEAAFGTDAEFYTFSGFETTIDDETSLTPIAIIINLAKFELTSALSSISGGVPYLIKTSKAITEIKPDGVKLVAAVKPTSKEDVNYNILGGKFNGTFVKSKVPNKGLFLSGNQFWYSEGDTDIKAFRGWFDLDAILGEGISLSRITMNFIDDEATGIKSVNGSGKDDRYFDLQGRRVKPLKDGLYIQGGKKVLIKSNN